MKRGGGLSSVIEYIYPKTEEPLSREGRNIAVFHAAVDEQSVRGIAVISMTGISTTWMGDSEGVSRRALVLSHHTQLAPVRSLKGGFVFYPSPSLVYHNKTAGPIPKL